MSSLSVKNVKDTKIKNLNLVQKISTSFYHLSLNSLIPSLKSSKFLLSMRCYVVTLWFIVSHFIYLSRLEELKRKIETPREDKQSFVLVFSLRLHKDFQDIDHILCCCIVVVADFSHAILCRVPTKRNFVKDTKKLWV